jgi:hypothetical protein
MHGFRWKNWQRTCHLLGSFSFVLFIPFENCSYIAKLVLLHNWFSVVDNRWVSAPQSKNCPTLLGIFQTNNGWFQSIVTTGALRGCWFTSQVQLTEPLAGSSCLGLGKVCWSEPAPTNAPSTRCTRCPLPISCGWTLPGLISGFTLVTYFVRSRSYIWVDR